MKYLCGFGLVFAVLLVGSSADAEWEADSGDKVQVNAARAIADFRERLPRTEQYFELAYGYVILPSVTRVGFGFGGAYGKGIVIEGDGAIGTTKFWQFSSGIQAGAKKLQHDYLFQGQASPRLLQEGRTAVHGAGWTGVRNGRCSRHSRVQ